MKINFEVANSKLVFNNSMFGKERLFVDGRLVSEKRCLGRKSFHDFIIDQQEYQLEIQAKWFPPQIHLTLYKGAEVVHDQWYTKQGKVIDSDQLHVPKFGWIFAAICGVIPVLSGGGAVPTGIGLGGAFGCIATARNSTQSRGRRIGVCIAISSACWIGIIVFILVIGGVQGYFGLMPWSVDQLTKAANEVNKKCPMTIDADTRLENVKVVKDTFSYNYTLVNYTVEEIDPIKFKSILMPNLKIDACRNNQLRLFMKNGVTVRYRYMSKEGNLVTDINVCNDDCNN